MEPFGDSSPYQRFSQSKIVIITPTSTRTTKDPLMDQTSLPADVSEHVRTQL